MLGIPVALARRRASRAVGLAATAAAAAGYYVLARVGMEFGEGAVLPVAVAANLGNIVIAAMALVLMARAVRSGAH
jgi:lipopolysaccharide export LptBFGC system permease protein LptF